MLLLLLTPTVAPAVRAEVPVLKVRIDFARDGSFATAGDDVSDHVLSDSVSWTRGRSADFSAEATGAMSFTLRNDDGHFAAGSLMPGMPVHAYATYAAVDYPLSFGFIERVAPDPREKTITITVYDVLRRLGETDVVVPANAYVQRSARDFRVEVLNDFERGTLNLLANPSFETNIAGWDSASFPGGTLTRITTDHAPDAGGTACGQWVTTNATARLFSSAVLAPVFFAGQVYRFSVYLKAVSGSTTWTIGLWTDTATQVAELAITGLAAAWTRYTVTFTMPITISANVVSGSPRSLVAEVVSTGGAGTVLLDGAMVTRGQALYPYADTGTGRYPNFIGNGSFDGGALNGWYDGFTNLCANPSFEVNTTGWSAAGDAFTGLSALNRVVSNPKFGTASAQINAGGAGAGAFYAITGTLKAGVAYDVSGWVKDTTNTEILTIGIGSQGTPADKAQGTASTAIAGYHRISVAWTPSADRTDAHLYVFSNAASSTIFIDGFMVTRRDTSAVAAPTSYSDTGPGGGGSFITTRALSATAKYGSSSQSVTTPATATAGRAYDFAHLGPVFVSGKPYTLSMWLRPTSNMPYRVGIGANKGDGTWDEASVTGTATLNVWTQVTVTWTPSADRTSLLPMDVVAYVYQTDATARTFLIDGVRVIPGASADAFELAQWSLAGEPDMYSTSASLSGSALSALSTINALTLTRHWISPAMASPWYTYRTDSRTDIAAKSSVETFDDDLNDMSSAEIDRASIINVVSVSFPGGTEFYSDAASVNAYGPRPGADISGATFFASRAFPDILGPLLVARYKDPKARPAIKVVNRFPSQLSRELDDLVTVNFARLGISGGTYLVLRLDTALSDGGNTWTTTLQLEAS